MADEQTIQQQVQFLQEKCKQLENKQATSTNPIAEIVKPVAKAVGVLTGTIGGAIDGKDPMETGTEVANDMGKIVDTIFAK